jgi:hypothetical protein
VYKVLDYFSVKKRYLGINIYVMIKLKFILNLFYNEVQEWAKAASYALNR